MLSGKTQSVTLLSATQGVGENVCTFINSPTLIEELISLLSKKHQFEIILIDCQESGLLFPTEVFFQITNLAKQLLEVEGSLIFLASHKAMAVKKESLIGDLALHNFCSYTELFDYSPTLTKHVLATTAKTEILPENTDLTQQVLLSSVPVLKEQGIKEKANRESVTKTALILSVIDNFTPISAICLRLNETHNLSTEQVLQEIKSLELQKFIYPVFAKVPFLVNCFRNRSSFTIKDYLLASQLITQSQFDELMVNQLIRHGKEATHIGGQLLKLRYINARQLEVIMQDLAFYGQRAGLDSNKLIKASSDEVQLQTLVGYLGTTDPANLLQNFAQNRDTGVLSIEHGEAHFRAHFDEGRLLHAKMGKIMGNKAIVEFASAWKEGIFVFIQRKPPADLAVENCKLTKNLDKLLLEAALAKDNMDQDMLALPKKMDIILEKLPDTRKLLDPEGVQNLAKDPKDNAPLSEKDIKLMKRLWLELDGLTKLSNVIRKLGDIARYEGVRAAHLLIYNGLSHVPETDLAQPLQKFNMICRHIAERIGIERSTAFLRLSLRDALGYSARASLYVISVHGELGIDESAAHSARTSLSQVLQDIEDWQVKYIEYASQEINPNELMAMIQAVHTDQAK